jgi:hypothetical protein
MNPQCNRDQVINEACGDCGSRRLTCDGCFWVSEPCVGEGVCSPGEVRGVPCFENECGDGFASSIECNDQCDWDPPSPCVGCLVGSVEEQVVECKPGYQCGEVVYRTTCEMSSAVDICDGYDQLIIGEEVVEQLGECVIECEPGSVQTSSCTLADGRAGEQTVTCTDECEWGPAEPCGAVAGACVPGTIETEERTCGSGACAGTYTRIQTCSPTGDGFSTSIENDTCPDCSEGQTRTAACTTELGECGTQTVTCDPGTCTWNAASGPCVARPSSCVPGTVETQELSCGSDTCGATYTVDRTCKSNGCGWNEVADTSACPDCTPGSVEQESCLTSDDRCGTRTRTCSTSSCSWTGWSACEPLPEACSAGAVEYRPCSGMCGSTGTEVWQCQSCTWHMVSSCDATPPCTPGEEEILGECRPGVPACGYQTRTCDADCTWVETGCPPCG